MRVNYGKYLILASLVFGVTGGANLFVTSEVADATIIKNLNSHSRIVTINGNDFSRFFTANHNATISGNMVTLTNDSVGQIGNTLLNTKIDMSQSFTLNGKINLGNKGGGYGGGDGIGFVFQPGDTNVIGLGGNSMGIGGVKGAFGFKLDTYYNSDSDKYYSPDPTQFSDFSAFGAFVDGTSGVAKTLSDGAQKIDSPNNNQFKNITVSYDGDTKVMTINYDGKVWSRSVAQYIDGNTSMSFGLASSTGLFHNLQQFQLTDFSYTVAQGSVITHYIDTLGNNIAEDTIQSGDLQSKWTTTPKQIPGFTLKKVEGNTSGQYTANDQNVTYIYSKNQSNININYIDDSTNKILLTDNIGGNIGDKSSYKTADKIKKYLDKGYALVSDSVPSENLIFTSANQNFDVHLKHKTTIVNPSKPGKPGKPINPTDVSGPKWGIETSKAALTKNITETIHYIYENGKQAFHDVFDEITFEHEFVIDNVTGQKISDHGWKSNINYFSKKVSPVIAGYTPSKSVVGRVDNITENSDSVYEKIVYSKNIIGPITPNKPILPESNTTSFANPNNSSLEKLTTGTDKEKSLPKTDSKLTSSLSILGVLMVGYALFVGIYSKFKKN
ncbi:hypothetical protein WOSG25_050650 [Weissella oryzae SG25]|uniref:MucBP domain-containing protein n=1 Tax=Weissella oryzae (strain DSM 25784 / JCM 18191 / LMG 30913 / SG25) TaxID=1329250 RepID=A0A069CUC3_WEIOS|nr:MucBP domain-containing protein [Weissella oryzae]GAK30793.1 hypothetical protein WOSG25_050650 [Weissella oryzae SG25]